MLVALDTSTAQIGLALYDGDRVLGETNWVGGRHHTVELASALSGLLKRCGVSLSGVCALGVAIGTGSFTSLRVGLSLAKGVALARNIPLIGIPTLDVIAAAQPLADIPLAALIQAGRTRVAFGAYQNLGTGWQAQGAARGATLDELLTELSYPAVVAGELTSEERKKISKVKHLRLASPALCVRRPALLAELAWARWQADDVDDPAALAPIYLHAAGSPIE
ncbi:MAG: tRNA (adenosine(37)-N6)-threonylcarbamoyltransferase complex dimerization subunit type 1 TsaB [Anaerolineales bacterium]|nr:tRNA (adenosine(37)-N6)-threonylcarbamoyltransferase complex dimerization subunit type 1 TsaB [Anaerolineales bacterium]